MNEDWQDLIEQLQQNNPRALSRMITKVENRDVGWENAMGQLYPKTGRSQVFGITGAPGSGKSTLTRELALVLLEEGLSIGIIAVDPSSPFSHGALLGDRLRMQELYDQPRVFIRSMATRGHMGGLCRSARDVTRILDVAGKDIILIETVGVGQDEIDIIRISDVVLVVCVPGQGDGIQAIKAGIMEIADVFVVNKADRDGADELVDDIKGMLALTAEPDASQLPPVLKTSALKKEGIYGLVETIRQFPKRLRQFQNQQIKEEITRLLESEVQQQLRWLIDNDERVDTIVSMVTERKTDPYAAAGMIFSELVDPLFHSRNYQHREIRKKS